MTEKEKKLLLKELKSLEQAANILSETFSHCQSIGLKKEYSFLELIHLEALTSRFARLSDMLIRKIFRLINQLDYEPQETVRDSINRAEKIGIIENASVFAEIRETRNAIAHEYLLEDLSLLYKSVFTYTPQLIETANRVKKYCKRY
ncbi:MAG: hypothetical protein LLF94_08800 [Chlamydiales bacterium]|nr:hypothetical protein [Chlamydiales bacterium]